MKGILFLSFLTLFIYSANAQKQADTAPIVEEGKRLYQSEMASWYGTDIFLERFKEEQENIGGYLSYGDRDSARCVFYSKGPSPLAIATIIFDSTYDIKIARVDKSMRTMTPLETDLAVLRLKAMEVMNSDTMFRMYNNTNFNIIPIISGNEKKVYVLTGPKNSGVVIFGNDYLLRFDKDNSLISKKQLHRNIIPIEYGKQQEMVVLGTMHSHSPETGDLITATDICTLMLYSKFANWKQHYVISENYVSIWDCLNNQLITITREAWDKMGKDQEKRNKDK